jgi:hypothetical protein
MTEAAITPAEAPAAEEAQAQHAEKTYTQADIDRMMGERIAGVKSKFADYDDLKAKAAKLAEYEAAQMTEAEKAKAEADALRVELESAKNAAKAAELAALKLKVGTEKGLPSALIDRLAGEDAESIAADADAILAALPKQVTSTTGTNPPSHEESAADSLKQAIRTAAGLK